MDYLKIWTSFREVISPLNDAEKGRLFDAMLLYAETGEQPDLKGNERYIWPTAKQAIDRAEKKADTLRQNGNKGGRPPKEENQTKPNETKEKQTKANESNLFDKDKEKEKEKVKENHLTVVKEKPLTRFTPPSVDDVRAYCQERGNRVDAQRFVDFYASKGWRVGNQPMKDWRAAVRTWERDDRPVKTVSAQQYTQRDYTEDDLDAATADLINEAQAMKVVSA